VLYKDRTDQGADTEERQICPEPHILLSRTSENIISLSLEIRKRNLAGRIAFVLLYFSKELYHSRIFDLPVSRKEIADLISMSSANVIRTFSEFGVTASSMPTEGPLRSPT
jgi:hypothetical protein